MRTYSLPMLALAAMVLALACQTTDGMVQPPDVPLPETNYFAIETSMGRMVIQLSDLTPVHRDNFKRLAVTGAYDSTRFHRVIAGFMIQGGDPNSRTLDLTNDGQGGPGYTLPAEMGKGLYHVRGALAAARTSDAVNPERRSSGSQFYIVHGSIPIDSTELVAMRARVRESSGSPAFEWPEEVVREYRTTGGAPFLDEQYTVFGRLVEGFEVLDAIATVNTGRMRGIPGPHMDQPPAPVWMRVIPLDSYTPPSDEPEPGENP